MASNIEIKSVLIMHRFLTILFFMSTAQGSLNRQHSPNSIEPENIFYFYQPFKKSSSVVLQLEKPKNMTCLGTNLEIDQSCIIIQSNVDQVAKFQYQSMECENCSLLDLKPLKPFHAQELVIKFASLGTVWQVQNEDNETICSLEQTYLGENSWYHINVNETGCSLVCDKQPERVPYPIIFALGFYTLLYIAWFIGKKICSSRLFSKLFHQDSLEKIVAAFSESSSIEEKKKPSQQRLRSLDTVRGIAITIMIFVNYGGGKYSFFHHSRWNGLTVADLVFPWFIWMMGMSMALSLKSQLRKIVSRKKIFFKIVKRSLKLFALGLMLNTLCQTVNLDDLRIPGVLQRFSISYFVVATVHLFYASAEDEARFGSRLRDITSYGGEWLIMLTFLTIHILLMYLVHEPYCPKGYFGPGGLHDHGVYENCTGGAAGYIDRMLLGSSHIYQHPESKAIYQSKVPYDPEGILGFFTSIFLVFLGLQAGKILLMFKEPKARMIRWMVWALLTGSVAGILCCFSKNNGWIPVNKNLWSVSFILATASLAFVLLTICYFFIDVQKFWTGAPFYHAGMNSILLYVGHELTHQVFPWSWKVPPTHMNELFLDLWGTSLWVIIAIWMHYKNVFIAV